MKSVNVKLLGEGNYLTQEAYKTLRTSIQFCGQDIKVIALTSCNEDDGKSSIALQLAKNFSDIKRNVLLLDADMRKSVLASRDTDGADIQGLSEVLSGMATIQECIYNTQYEQLFIMFAGQYPPDPVELLNSKHFDHVIEVVRKTFDYIIIDTPPLGLVIDAAVITSHCDGAALVISDKKTKIAVAQDVVNKIRNSGCRVLGVIKNNKRKKVASGYGYRYGKKKYYYYRNTEK